MRKQRPPHTKEKVLKTLTKMPTHQTIREVTKHRMNSRTNKKTIREVTKHRINRINSRTNMKTIREKTQKRKNSRLVARVLIKR